MSTLSHPVILQSHRDKSKLADGGCVVCTQSFATLTVDGANAVSKTIYLPAGAKIHGFVVKNDVVWNAGSSAALSIGTAAAGTQYLTSLDTKTAAGLIPLTATHVTGTQSANWKTIGANTTMVATVTPSGTTATTGTTNIDVIYSVPA